MLCCCFGVSYTAGIDQAHRARHSRQLAVAPVFGHEDALATQLHEMRAQPSGDIGVNRDDTRTDLPKDVHISAEKGPPGSQSTGMSMGELSGADSVCLRVAAVHEHLGIVCIALVMASYHTELQVLSVTHGTA